MAGQTVSAHLDQDLVIQLREVMRGENRPASQIISTALKTFLDVAPGSRQSIYTLNGSASEAEQAFLARFVGRQILRAHHTIVENRYLETNRDVMIADGSNALPQTEEDLENEAARICRTM